MIRGTLAGFKKFDGAEHITVICQSKMFHPRFPGFLGKLFYRGGAVQKGIIGMDMQMDKIGHGLL
jgi:hypothetical protein